MGLTAEEVLETADRLIRDEGVEKFTMRALAAELDVNPMTVYLRFDNKAELLDALVARSMSDFELPDLETGPWADRATLLAHTIRNQMLGDRHLMPIYRASKSIQTSLFEGAEQAVGLFQELGLDKDDAVRGVRALFWHAVGFALAVDRHSDADQRVEPIGPSHFGELDPHDLFAYSTRVLVHGFEAESRTGDGS